MSLVNDAISGFVGGVSQQPADVRHPTQCDAMVNMVPSVASGTRKRTGTRMIAKLASAGVDYTYAFVHPMDRGVSGTDDERYFLIVNNGQMQIFDYNGNPRSISTGAYGFSYISGVSNARDNFAATTVADYTFLTNRTVNTGMVTASPYTAPEDVYMVIKVGVASTTYGIVLNGTDYGYHSGSTETDTVAIATHIATNINGSGGLFTCTQIDNLLWIQRGTAPTGYYWNVYDSYGNQATLGFRDQVERYEDLPRKFRYGPIIHVTGAPDATESGYYVTWTFGGNTQFGVWNECAKPGLNVSLQWGNMPFTVIRQSDGSFKFDMGPWVNRAVGDDKSNPVPSFVGRPIKDVFFHRNRLGFLADENVIMSKAGDYFNFFASSARTAIDSDPIDVAASTNKVTYLRHVVPFNNSLLLFSDKAQFQLSSGDILTPKTVKLEPVTMFESTSLCPPVALGRTVFFPTVRGDYTTLREYYYDGMSVANDALDVTAHVPSYVPANVVRISGAGTENMLFCLSADDPSAIYVYNSMWNGDQKVQSAWHVWRFDPSSVIISAEVFGTELNIIVQRADGLYLERVDLVERPDSPAPYTLCLDSWVQFNTGNYVGAQKTTFWTLPYNIPNGAVPCVVIANKPGSVGLGLVPTQVSANTVSLPGDYRHTVAVIGIRYDSRVTMSEIFFRQYEYMEGKKPVVRARVQLRDVTVSYDRTGYFEAQVTPQGRDMDRYVYSGNNLGLSSMILGTQPITEGTFTFPVMCKSDEVKIDLVNGTHLPSSFVGFEWQGAVAMRAMRR